MELWYVLLKRERIAHLLTQSALAEKIGTDARTIRTWESGENYPSMYFRRKLCDLYNKEPQELGLDEDSPSRVIKLADVPLASNLASPSAVEGISTSRELADEINENRNVNVGGDVVAADSLENVIEQNLPPETIDQVQDQENGSMIIRPIDVKVVAAANATTKRVPDLGSDVGEALISSSTYPYAPPPYAPPPPHVSSPLPRNSPQILKIAVPVILAVMLIIALILWSTGFLHPRLTGLSLSTPGTTSTVVRTVVGSAGTGTITSGKKQTNSPTPTNHPGSTPTSTSTHSGVTPTSTTTSTPTSQPTLDPTATLPPASGLFWGFDGSTQGWGTSEGCCKPTTTSDASSPVYSGNGSLRVTTELIGTGSSAYPGNTVYTHTEATNYFSSHNFSGATVSCYVYLPPGLAPGGTAPGYIDVFVKDTQFRNDFSLGTNLSSSTVGRWLLLSFVIGSGSTYPDTGFDATQVSAIGVRVVLYDGATLNYNGPFYIDSCSIH